MLQDFIEAKLKSKEILVSKLVIEELRKKETGEYFCKLLKSYPESIIESKNTPGMQEKLTEVLNNYKRCIKREVTALTSSTDLYVITVGGLFNATVISMERSKNREKRQRREQVNCKIPDICDFEGINHGDLTIFALSNSYHQV